MFAKVTPLSDKTKYANFQKNGSFNTMDLGTGNSMQFGKVPSSVKGSFNSSFDSNNPELIYTPKTTSMPFRLPGDEPTHQRINSDSQLDTSISAADVELEFQVNALKNENKQIKQQYETTLSRLNQQREIQFNTLTTKIEQANEQALKDRLMAESLSQNIAVIEAERNDFAYRFEQASIAFENIFSKLQQSAYQLQITRQDLRNIQIEFSQVTNQRNYLDHELNAARIQLKNSQEKMVDSQGKQDNLRNMIMTMSQEKTLLNNRISQMLEQQARLENAQSINRLHQMRNDTAKPNINDQKVKDMAQQIEYLKNRIQQILSQQEAGSLKKIYEQKVQNLERQIQQLKNRYNSSSSAEILIPTHDKVEQQWKRTVDGKDREIIDLKNVVNNNQVRINQLTKDLENERARKSSLTTNISDVEVNNLKNENKNQKRAIDLAEEKLKYLITESRKKDDFLKQYLSTSMHKGNEDTFVQDFFKKYSYDIPSDGFSRLVMKDAQTIRQLQEKVQSLTNRLYERR